MFVHNCKLHFYKVLKRRNIYCGNVVSSVYIRKVQTLSKIPLATDPLYYFNSLFDSSAKPFLDISKIHLLDTFFKSRSKVKCTYNFVINESVAKDIVEKIFNDIDKRERVFIEGNPGVGLITINLINSDADHICVFENSDLQYLSLTQILKKYPNIVTQKFGNLNKDIKLILRSFDDAQANNLTATFILIATSCYFIRLIVVLYLKYRLWSPNLEIYLVLSNTIYQSLKNYTPKSLKFLQFCVFNLLFVVKEIANYPSSAFLPVCKSNEENMNLIKISKNLNPHIQEDEFIYFIVFISILGKKKNNFIIPALEKWFPDCGPYLISKGISMTNQVCDLSFEESITLFKCLQKCEGFDSFKACTLRIYEENL